MLAHGFRVHELVVREVELRRRAVAKNSQKGQCPEKKILKNGKIKLKKASALKKTVSALSFSKVTAGSCVCVCVCVCVTHTHTHMPQDTV